MPVELKILQSGEYKNFFIRNSFLYVFEDGDYVLVVPKTMQKEIIRNVTGRIKRIAMRPKITINDPFKSY